MLLDKEKVGMNFAKFYSAATMGLRLNFELQ